MSESNNESFDPIPMNLPGNEPTSRRDPLGPLPPMDPPGLLVPPPKPTLPFTFNMTTGEQRPELPIPRPELPIPRPELPIPRADAPPRGDLMVTRNDNLPPKFEMSAPTPRQEMPLPRIEIPSARPELPVSRPEMPAPRQEMPLPRIEIPAPRQEMPLPRIEIPAPRQEMPAPRMEMPAPRVEMPAPRQEQPMPPKPQPPASGPRPEFAPRQEVPAPKPMPPMVTAPSNTPAPAASDKPPVPSTKGLAGEMVGVMFRPTRAKLTFATGILSLIAGAASVKYLVPANTPTGVSQSEKEKLPKKALGQIPDQMANKSPTNAGEKPTTVEAPQLGVDTKGIASLDTAGLAKSLQNQSLINNGNTKNTDTGTATPAVSSVSNPSVDLKSGSGMGTATPPVSLVSIPPVDLKSGLGLNSNTTARADDTATKTDEGRKPLDARPSIPAVTTGSGLTGDSTAGAGDITKPKPIIDLPSLPGVTATKPTTIESTKPAGSNDIPRVQIPSIGEVSPSKGNEIPQPKILPAAYAEPPVPAAPSVPAVTLDPKAATVPAAPAIPAVTLDPKTPAPPAAVEVPKLDIPPINVPSAAPGTPAPKIEIAPVGKIDPPAVTPSISLPAITAPAITPSPALPASSGLATPSIPAVAPAAPATTDTKPVDLAELGKSAKPSLPVLQLNGPKIDDKPVVPNPGPKPSLDPGAGVPVAATPPKPLTIEPNKAAPPALPAPGTMPALPEISVEKPMATTEPKSPLRNPPVVQPAPELAPPATLNVRPTSATQPIASSPQTDYDEDVYNVQRGDTYVAISKQYYGDERYASALQAHNKERPITDLRNVLVPPIHVLRKQYPSQLGRNPGEMSRVNGDPVRGGLKTYIVPAGGQGIREIAAAALGDPNQWERIYDLNRNLYPDRLIPAQTSIYLPSDSKIGK